VDELVNATSMASEVEPTPSRARAAAAFPRSNVMVSSLALHLILPLAVRSGKDALRIRRARPGPIQMPRSWDR